MTNKLKLNDKLILIFCFCIIAICCFFIFNLDYIRNTENESIKIGLVKVKGQDVRKKIGTEYFWKNIEGSVGIHRGDSIFAGEKSSAIIDFDNGDSLTLKENSLVKFENKRNSLSIDIAFGQLQVVSKTKFITVKDCGKDVLIEAQNASFGIDKGRECGDVQIKVKSGEVKMANKVINSKSETPSFKLRPVKNLLSVEKLVKALEKPQNIHAHIQMSQKNEFDFLANWEPIERAKEYEIEIALDPKMKKSIKRYSVDTNKISIVNINSDFIYYRIRANESAENLGIFSPISMATAKYAPRNIKGHIQLTKNGDLEFLTNWDTVENTKEYEIEISSDPLLKTDVQKFTSLTNYFELQNIKHEALYYRVRANETSEKLGVFSTISLANVKETLNPPEIKSALFQVDNQNSLSLHLGLLPVEKSSQYRVEISDSIDFKKIKFQTLSNLKTKFSGLDQTFTYVRARAENKFAKSEFSTPKLVSFKYEAINSTNKILTKKCMVKNLNETGTKNDFNVDWQPVPMADEYHVKVLDNKTSTQVSENRSREPASVITIPACGDYAVKIEAFDKGGRKISSEFDASKILYKTTVALLTPIISDSEKKLDIFFQKGVGRFIWLKWNGLVKDDNFFKVEVATDSDFKSNYKQFDVKDNKLLLKSKLQTGEYFWRVREYRADLFSDWSEVAKIRVISNKPD